MCDMCSYSDNKISSMSNDSVLERILQKRQEIKRANAALFWTIINFFILIVFYFEMTFGNIMWFLQFIHPWAWYSACAVVVICMINLFANGYHYIRMRLLSTNIELTETQAKLIGVSPHEQGFHIIKDFPVNKSVLQASPEYSPSSFTGHLTCRYSSPPVFNNSCHSLVRHLSLSPLSSLLSNTQIALPCSMSPTCVVNNSPCIDGSPVCGIGSSDRWSSSPFSTDEYLLLRGSLSISPSAGMADYHRTSSDAQLSVMVDKTEVKAMSCNLSPLKSEDCMHDRCALEEYLQEQDKKQSLKCAAELQQIDRGSSLFWNYGRSSLDSLPALRHYQYQLSARSPSTTTCNECSHDECGNPVGTDAAADIWCRLGVSQYQLDHWVENLRKWLGNTILCRVVKEIDEVNVLLRRAGSEDIQVGDASLSTLKQVGAVKALHVPQLAALLPYLDLISNQEYLVQRIRDLATGCMSSFKWNGGAEFIGKPWDETLPTDSRILIHLLCTYLDSRLPCHPTYSEGKTFTSQHFVIAPDKSDIIDKKDNLVLYLTCLCPPLFKVVIDGTIWNVKQGRENLFHAVLLLLYHIKFKEHGMLRRVNLGMSGLNILWVFDE